MNNYFRLGENCVEAHGVLKAYILKGSPEWELMLMIEPFPPETVGPEAPCLALLDFPKQVSNSTNPWLNYFRHQFDDTAAFYWTPCGENLGAEAMSAELWRGEEHAPGFLTFKGGGLVDSGHWSEGGGFGPNVPVRFTVEVRCDTITCLEDREDGVLDETNIQRIFGSLPISLPELDPNGHRIFKVLL